MDRDQLITKSIDLLDEASTSLLMSLSKLVALEDQEPLDFDPVTPMAAALRAINRAAGLLEALGMSLKHEDEDEVR